MGNGLLADVMQRGMQPISSYHIIDLIYFKRFTKILMTK